MNALQGYLILHVLAKLCTATIESFCCFIFYHVMLLSCCSLGRGAGMGDSGTVRASVISDGAGRSSWFN